MWVLRDAASPPFKDLLDGQPERSQRPALASAGAGRCGIEVAELEQLAPGLIGSGGWISTGKLLGRLAGTLRRPIPKAIRDEVRRRDGRRCGYCHVDIRRSEAIHLDHITPVTAGGLNELANLTVSCQPCNMAKARRVGFRLDCGHLSWQGREPACARCDRMLPRY